MPDSKNSSATTTAVAGSDSSQQEDKKDSAEGAAAAAAPANANADVETDAHQEERRVLIKKLRKLVLLGAGCGLAIAFIIGAVFLAVFYTQSDDL